MEQAGITRGLRAAYHRRKAFLWPRGDWVNRAQTQEELTFKINQV
jgi:hypothetical protein